jgi:Rad3-related DNA helicase
VCPDGLVYNFEVDRTNTYVANGFVVHNCHTAADVARDFFGWRYGEGSFRKLARYVRGTDPRLMEGIERAAGFFFEQMLSLKHDRDRYKAHVVPSRLNRHDVEACEGLLARLSEFTQRVDKDLAYLDGEGEEASDAERAKERALKLSNAVASVLNGPSDDEVVFVEEDEFRKASVACRLVRPGKVLHGALFSRTITKPKDPEDPDAPDPEPQPVSVVCTSATLATDSGFGFAKEELGVAECAELVVESPFDFENQALMILPKLCDPSDPLFTSECAAVLLRTIVLARGRTLGLFTSRKRMNEVYDLVAGKTPYRILRQDDGQRTALVEEFRRDTHSVLLGVASFWAGVDVPGESLSVVFIDKIPFPQPDDPVVERRTETDKATFFNYVVPKSIIELKQGVGRLIRSSTDRGVIVVCDRRIHPKVKRYSNQILRSMPAGMQKVHNLESIADWLDDPGALAVAEPPPASPPVEEIDPFS